MTLLQAFLLGLVQGITEFLPVSSSGHLTLFQALMGLHHLDQYLVFDLVCHAGTLLAIFVVLYKEIFASFTQERRMLGLIFCALLPLGPLYLLLSHIKALYGLPQFLGIFFLVTAGLLYAAERFAPLPQPAAPRRYRDAFFIGCAQAVAVLPAISRSGSTIATARLLGWEPSAAARFSFLLAIPTILGGMAVEMLSLWKGKTPALALPMHLYLVGAVTAFISGACVLKLFLKLLSRLSLKPFAYYCALVGIFALLFL